MPDLITALRADPHDSEKVEVFVDGISVLTVSLDVAAEERLTIGQECGPARIEKLRDAQQLDDMYAAAVRFLSYRPRSVREVELRLARKGNQRPEIEQVIERLRKRGFVDDVEFARFWVSNRMAFSPRGPRLLKSELRQKGVSSQIIDEVLADQHAEQAELVHEAALLDEDSQSELTPGTDLSNAVELAMKRARSYSRFDLVTQKRRLSSFLVRRGYNYDVIESALKIVLSRETAEGL